MMMLAYHRYLYWCIYFHYQVLNWALITFTVPKDDVAPKAGKVKISYL